MVKIETRTCTAHVRAGELGAVIVSARAGEKAGVVNVRVGDDPASMVRDLQGWLGFGAGQERKILAAVKELRNGGSL